MCTLKQKFAETESSNNSDPIAIVSGDNIYVVYSTGAVSAIKKSFIHSLKTKELLARCDFWGDLATF
jgi:hypothetical protein